MAGCRFPLGVGGTCDVPFFLCAHPLFPFVRPFTPTVSTRSSMFIAFVRIPVVRNYLMRHSFHVILPVQYYDSPFTVTMPPLLFP